MRATLSTGLAVLLPNESAASRRETAECPLKPGLPNREEQRYFVLFTRPHSGADFLCKLLNRHPEITCAGELFNPAHQGVERQGFTAEQQRQNVAGFVTAHFDKCRTRVCGFRMMASHLPREALPRLFIPGCGVQKVILERTNVTAEFLARSQACPAGGPPSSSGVRPTEPDLALTAAGGPASPAQPLSTPAPR